jgi:hypothetical protein
VAREGRARGSAMPSCKRANMPSRQAASTRPACTASSATTAPAPSTSAAAGVWRLQSPKRPRPSGALSRCPAGRW